MTRSLFFGIFAMAIVVVTSNILVQHLFGNWLTWGAFTYPFAFLITDVMNRVFGPKEARRVVFAGFIVGVLCSFIGTQIMGEYGPLVTLRVAFGSGVAFLTAQLLDVAIFDRLRNRAWWQAPVASTVFGSSIDTMLFFFLAFSAQFTFFGAAENEAVVWAAEAVPLLGIGPIAPLWVSLAVADWAVKLVIALVALVPFRAIVLRLTAKI
ncbi:MAG: queuosine precursor transporter [Halocynthiibacter sp.]